MFQFKKNTNKYADLLCKENTGKLSASEDVVLDIYTLRLYEQSVY